MTSGRSILGRFVTAAVAGYAVMWAWAVTRPVWTVSGLATRDNGWAGTGDGDLRIAIVPYLLFVLGAIGGALGWFLLVERRRLDLLSIPAPRFGAFRLGLAAVLWSLPLLLWVSGQAWSQRVTEIHRSSDELVLQAVNRYDAITAAALLTIPMLLWLLAVAAPLLLPARESAMPAFDAAAAADDEAWEAWRRRISRPDERPLFRDEPDPVR
ncbi:MAG: hypothetical protein U0869_08090 [Chloroflexota bacterium]